MQGKRSDAGKWLRRFLRNFVPFHKDVWPTDHGDDFYREQVAIARDIYADASSLNDPEIRELAIRCERALGELKRFMVVRKIDNWEMRGRLFRSHMWCDAVCQTSIWANAGVRQAGSLVATGRKMMQRRHPSFEFVSSWDFDEIERLLDGDDTV